MLFLAAVLLPLAVAAREPGSAKGTIAFNGKPKNVSYVYAWRQPSEFNKGQTSTVVVLMDTKIDDATLADRFAMIDSAKSGKFTAVQSRRSNAISAAERRSSRPARNRCA